MGNFGNGFLGCVGISRSDHVSNFDWFFDSGPARFLIPVPYFSKKMGASVIGISGCVEGQRWLPCSGGRRSICKQNAVHSKQKNSFDSLYCSTSRPRISTTSFGRSVGRGAACNDFRGCVHLVSPSLLPATDVSASPLPAEVFSRC